MYTMSIMFNVYALSNLGIIKHSKISETCFVCNFIFGYHYLGRTQFLKRYEKSVILKILILQFYILKKINIM